MVAGKLFRVAALASAVVALPTQVEKRANLDVDILQFALTLEHLENAFYSGALSKFSAEDFEKAGYSADYYNNLKYIAYDEATHVAALEGALKAAKVTPVAACKYSFPYTTPLEFITLSSVLEGVGTSAYLGAAPLVTSKEYLTVAGSILAVEALHTSLQRNTIMEIPNANPFYTPLDGDSVYTLAAMFITSCPKGNMKLPFTPFPTLQLNGKSCTDEQPESNYYGHGQEKRWGGNGQGWPSTWQPSQNTCSPPSAGSTVSFTAANNVPAGSYVTFVNGLTVASVPATISGKTASAKVPSGLGGQTYAFITKSSETSFADAAVLFGPAVVEVKPAAE